jgi:hypothetical protein
MDSDDDGTPPYGKPLWENVPELSRRIRMAIEAAAGTHITCQACLQALMSINVETEPKDIAKQIVPNLQILPEIRERIGGINQQYEWLTEIIKNVFAEMSNDAEAVVTASSPG